jgi:hypothetical protein
MFAATIYMSFLNHQYSSNNSLLFISPLQLQSRALVNVVLEGFLSKVGLQDDIPIQANRWI